jgi:hypothetical protein
LNPQEVYMPTKTGTPNVVEPPKDMGGWLQQHPYLQTDQPEPVRVGGVEGVRFDVIVAKDLPKDHYGMCGTACVDLVRLSDGAALGILKGDKIRMIILEDVKDETVITGFGGPVDGFDTLAPQAQKVIDSVEWRGK